jgi:hypothetical protein
VYVEGINSEEGACIYTGGEHEYFWTRSWRIYLISAITFKVKKNYQEIDHDADL